MLSSLNTYESLLGALPLPCLLIARDERVIAANDAAQQLLGQGLVSRHYVSSLRQPSVLDGIESVLAGTQDRADATYLTTGPSREVTYRVTVARVDLDAEPAIMVSFVDVTDIQQAGQIRRDFVANVSHELRTPLTALLGFIETLRGAARDDADARERFLMIMEREAGRMNRLVKDLLSLSKLEGQERLRPQDPVDIAGIMRSVASSLRPLAEDAEVTLTTDVPEAEVMVPGDADQLAQVLSNLVENAIKYSGAGAQVELSLTLKENSPLLRAPAAILSVADTGEGIDPLHIPRLTERFYRVDTHRSREKGGTGLGLAIVKHIVGRHRGRLRIESTPGQGSRFSVVLPRT
ncbi:MAG: ATP-binding protein [Pseudomonadota bacterium]